MLGPHWFFRMKRWAQHPPSPKKVALVLGIVAVCLALYGLEKGGLLPEWMAAERVGRGVGALRF